MRKMACILVLLGLAFSGAYISRSSAAAAPPRSSPVAVILLGSLEYQQPDYYAVVTETLTPRFPANAFTLFAGDSVQRMFDRYTDKLGLTPGDIPDEKALLQFAWSNSFDRVIFLMLTAPAVKTEDIPVHWENSRVTFTVRALSFDSRRKKKTSDALTTQSAGELTRDLAKRDAFRLCLENLRGKIQ